MGSPVTEAGHRDAEEQHQVSLTRGFAATATDITQAQFEGVMGFNPSGYLSCGGDCPVEYVSWYDALAYADELSQIDGVSPCFVFSDVLCQDSTDVGSDYMGCMNATQQGIGSAVVTLNGAATPYECEGYRLPTESEWEYAARAGTTTAYNDGMDSDPNYLLCETPFHLTDIAWYCANAADSTQPVGMLPPNDWGLSDMSGNVWQWVWDGFGAYPGDVADPTGSDTGSYRVLRGGSWFSGAQYCRSAYRSSNEPGSRNYRLGFRLARTTP